MASASSENKGNLAAGSVRLGTLIFHGISCLAPAFCTVFIMPVMASAGGASLVLAYIFATIACIFTGLSLMQITKKIRSAGALFPILTKALGPSIGFVSAWLWILFGGATIGIGTIVLGQFVSEFFIAYYPTIPVPAWPVTLIGIFLYTFSCYSGIRLSARLTMIFGGLEIGIIALLSLLLISHAGTNQPTIVWTLDSSPIGIFGIIFASIFAMTCFIGFEALIPLVEESYNAKRNLAIAIAVTIIAIGIFYIWTSYGIIAGVGAADPAAFGKEFSTNKGIMYQLADKAFGSLIGHWIILLAIFNSTTAGCIAVTNAVTRIYYSLGRAKVFPAWFSYISPKTQTPTNAIIFQGIISVIIAFGFQIWMMPWDVFVLIATSITIAVLIIYVMVNISCYIYYRYHYPKEFNWIKHALFPFLGGLLMLLPLAASLVPQWIFGYYNEYPVNLAVYVIIVWLIAGISLYLYVRATEPKAIQRLTNEMDTIKLAGEE